jgi:hypothetical protein
MILATDGNTATPSANGVVRAGVAFATLAAVDGSAFAMSDTVAASGPPSIPAVS